MTAALTLLVGALAAGWLVPGLLHRTDLRRHDPVLLVVVWLLSMIGVLVSAAVGVVFLLLPSHGPGTAVLTAVHECWAAIQHGTPPETEKLAGLLGLALLIAFVVRLAVVFVRGLRRRARAREAHLSVLRLVARADPNSPDTLWLAHDRPLAFSMAGRPGVVVATEGLVRHLDQKAVEAVFAHERAHLAGRHHLLIAGAEALRAAIPFLPLFRDAPRALRELVELSADAVAVRRCGTAAVRSALRDVSGHDAPSTSLAMARCAVDTRIARLQVGATSPTGTRRLVSCAMAGLAAGVLPFLAGAGLLAGIALISCPPGQLSR